MRGKINPLPIRFETPLIFLFVLQHLRSNSWGAIIPPNWANITINPCAKDSWQLLHWPQDSNCYNIFSQGPCEDTQEFYYDEDVGRASCRCPRGTSWHSDSKRCHTIYSKGPCGNREYFDIGDQEDVALGPSGECRKYGDCPPGHLYWPPSGKCYLHLSRGPCLDGHLLYLEPDAGATECGCHSEVMSTNFWHHGNSCHELFTKGPCVDGHIFIYNLTTGVTECVCDPKLQTNYHAQTGRCYELETSGPCRQGQVFTYESSTKEATCSCLPGYVEWLATGTCFRAFTRGPCPSGKFLQPHERKAGVGNCVKNSCTRGELFDPSSNKCYPVGRRGPCSKGKLWVFERATSVRGSCHCDPNLIGYWEPHRVCYELGERGPCQKRKILSYEKMSGQLRCRCDLRGGFVPWLNGRCIKAGVQRSKLVPVAGPLASSIRGNTIQTERIHRGLTLPLQEEQRLNGSKLSFQKLSPAARVMQEEILNDVLTTILRNNTGGAGAPEVEGTPEIAGTPIVAGTPDVAETPDVAGTPDITGTAEVATNHTQTKTETTTIHRVTVSRSVTRKRRQPDRAPGDSMAPIRASRMAVKERRVNGPKHSKNRVLRTIRPLPGHSDSYAP